MSRQSPSLFFFKEPKLVARPPVCSRVKLQLITFSGAALKIIPAAVTNLAAALHSNHLEQLFQLTSVGAHRHLVLLVMSLKVWATSMRFLESTSHFAWLTWSAQNQSLIQMAS